MDRVSALQAGAAGALTTTLLNETVRRFVPAAPRLDVVGERGVVALARIAGVRLPRRARYATAMGGDLASNALYYALAARSRRPVRAGVVLGLVAGLGALVLAPALGLGRSPVRRTRLTAALTVAWYGAGGLVAGCLAARRARA